MHAHLDSLKLGSMWETQRKKHRHMPVFAQLCLQIISIWCCSGWLEMCVEQELCHPDGKFLLRKLCMNWDQELWNSLKLSKEKNLWNKTILMSLALTQFSLHTAGWLTWGEEIKQTQICSFSLSMILLQDIPMYLQTQTAIWWYLH